MQAIQAASVATYLSAMLLIGTRLVLRARRGDGLPELLLGLALLLGGALGGGAEAVAGALGAGFDPAAMTAPGERIGRLLGVGKLLTLAGMAASCLFTWLVFCRHDAKALLIVAGIMLLQTSAWLGYAGAGCFASGVLDPRWFAVELAGRIAAPGWLATEAFLFWRAANRRARIGLGDPVAAARFLLWSLASMAGVLCVLASLPPLLLPADHALVRLAPPLLAAGGLGTALACWLSFFPTAGYRRWLAGAPAPA